MSSRRPRRSASGANYNAAQIFANMLGDPEDGGSSSDEQPRESMQPEAGTSNGPKSGQSSKNKGKQRAPVSETSSDGSNFDPSEPQAQEDEDDDLYDDAVPDESDDDHTNHINRDAELSESESIVDMSVRLKTHFPPTGPLRAKATRPGKKAPAASSHAVTPGVTGGLAPAGRKTTRAKTGGDTFWAQIQQSASQSSKSKAPSNRKNQPWEETFGYDGPEQEFMALSVPAADPIHTRSMHPHPATKLEDVGLFRFKCPIENSSRLNLNNAWRYTPFAATSSLCHDLGWYKGKGTTPMRWGGWYHHPRLHQGISELSFSDAEHYFPWEAQAKDTNEEEASMQAEIAEGQRQEEGEEPKEPNPPLPQLQRGTVPLWIGPGLPAGPMAPEGETTGQKQQQYFLMERFSAMRLDQTMPEKPGHVLNAGGPVWSLDWCPQPDVLHPAAKEYLAVATTTDQPAVGAFAQTAFSSNAPRLRGFIQLWSLDVSRHQEVQRQVKDYPDAPTMVFEGGLCVDVGEPWSIQWCPRGGCFEDPDSASLGILAGVFTDGRLHFFDVPRPKGDGAIYLRIQPILSLSMPETSIVSFDWASHERVVAGCENGHIVVWDIAQALSSGDESKLKPSYYIPVHEGAVRAVSVIRNQPASGDDLEHDDNGEPHIIGSSGTDGSQVFVDLRDQRTVSVPWHSRAVGMTNAFDTFLGCYLLADADDALASLQLRPQALGLSKRVTQHQGGVWGLASSPFHPFVASASADGACRVSNLIRKVASKHNLPYNTVVFRIDYSRRTGEFRMVDNIAPELQANSFAATGDEAGKRKRGKGKGATAEDPQPAAAWLPDVAAQAVSWGKSLHRPCLLATGTNCGLVRVDWVEGPLGEDAADFAVKTVLESRAWGQGAFDVDDTQE